MAAKWFINDVSSDGRDKYFKEKFTKDIVKSHRHSKRLWYLRYFIMLVSIGHRMLNQAGAPHL